MKGERLGNFKYPFEGVDIHRQVQWRHHSYLPLRRLVSHIAGYMFNHHVGRGNRPFLAVVHVPIWLIGPLGSFPIAL